MKSIESEEILRSSEKGTICEKTGVFHFKKYRINQFLFLISFKIFRYIRFGDQEDPKSSKEKDFELVEPSSMIKGLTMDDYEDLLADIDVSFHKK